MAVVVVVLGSFLFYQAAIAPAPSEDDPTTIVGSDRDEHGCIGSAGYSWCAVKEKCLREWEEPCDTTDAVEKVQTDPVVEVSPVHMTLTMKEWEWVQTSDEGGVIAPKTAGVFTLTFSGEGSVAIGTDCNSMSGTYERIGSGGGKQPLTFGPIASTMMYCEGSQEQEFSGMLSKTSAYAFTEKGELLLYQGDASVATFK